MSCPRCPRSVRALVSSTSSDHSLRSTQVMARGQWMTLRWPLGLTLKLADDALVSPTPRNNIVRSHEQSLCPTSSQTDGVSVSAKSFRKTVHKEEFMMWMSPRGFWGDVQEDRVVAKCLLKQEQGR